MHSELKDTLYDTGKYVYGRDGLYHQFCRIQVSSPIAKPSDRIP